ncbi:MAG: c-type cytochrome [Planctomycetota bacterium]
MSRREAPWVLVGLALVFLLGACNSGSTAPPQGPIGDSARGALMYDKWWTINGATEPTTDHPAYPAAGQKTGSTTWRCKECHGWDYLGAAGAYGDMTNSHFTGIAGVMGAMTDPPQTIFDAIKSGPNHDFSAVLSDDDVWDLVAFIVNGLVDMPTLIDPATDVAQGNVATGGTLYDGLAQCTNCHGPDGFLIDFGGGDGVVHVASGNPWETLHKIRWGHPGSAMPSAVVDGLTTQQQVDILAYSQTLLPGTASAGRGGLLYDKWWTINGATEPTTDHPAYPIPPGQKTGSTTWRCKECHGWDYLGAAGAYGDMANSHFTGIAGVWMARNDFPPDLFDAIKSGPTHDFSAVLSDGDVWDLVAFVRNGMLDMQNHIDPGTDMALGNAGDGQTLYEGSAQCSVCHGTDGKLIDFGGGDGVGDVATSNPWETLHKIRWGHPGSSMPSGVDDTGLSTTEQVDVLTHSQTLFQAPVSYANDVHPIWAARSCTNCHPNSGGLDLSGAAAQTFGQVNPGRIDLGTPANSLILTKPLGQSHGGGTIFSSTSDADYQTILAWIQQGAPNN